MTLRGCRVRLILKVAKMASTGMKIIRGLTTALLVFMFFSAGLMKLTNKFSAKAFRKMVSNCLSTGGVAWSWAYSSCPGRRWLEENANSVVISWTDGNYNFILYKSGHAVMHDPAYSIDRSLDF